MKKYYYLKGDAQLGPLTVDELKTQITRETLVWSEGMAEWTEAKNVPEIVQVLPPPLPGSKPPPPPPKPTQPNPELRSISYHQESKSNRKLWLILGGLGVCVALFLLYQSTVLPDPYLDSQPNVETTVIDDSTEFEEAEITSINETKKAENEAKKEKEAAEIKAEKERVLKLLICANFKQYFTAKVVSADVHNFGGMSEVFVEVSNETNYHAEEIHLHLQYLKENGDLWKDERMTAYDVGPWQSITVQAPGSHRGTRVKARVEVVESKALGLYEGYGYQ